MLNCSAKIDTKSNACIRLDITLPNNRLTFWDESIHPQIILSPNHFGLIAIRPQVICPLVIRPQAICPHAIRPQIISASNHFGLKFCPAENRAKFWPEIQAYFLGTK